MIKTIILLIQIILITVYITINIQIKNISRHILKKLSKNAKII